MTISKPPARSRLRKEDRVIVTNGREKGKVGKVISIDYARQRVIIEGVNMVKKAMRKRTQTDRGGIVEIEAAIHISNVMALTKDGRPSRIGYTLRNGRKVRVLRRNEEIYDDN